MRKDLSGDKSFYLFVIACFVILALIGLLHHELWLDEAHHWLVSRDSASLSDLLQNMRYDGHPILWNIFLFAIGKLSDNFFWMQALNATFSTIAISLFLFNAPFGRLQKCLFVFSYFILYEYTIISRNYSLILLLSFLCMTLYPNRSKKYILLGIIIALMMNTHLFGLFIGISFCIIMVSDFILKTEKNSDTKKTALLGIVIAAIGLGLSVYQITPPKDSRLAQSFFDFALEGRGQRIISFFVKGFLPIPDLYNPHFWNSNFMVSHCRFLAGLLSLVFLVIPLFMLRQKILAVTFFYTITILLMGFFYVSGMSASRYSGIIFITFIISIWIAHYEKPSDSFIFTALPLRLPDNASGWCINTILSIQFLAMIPFFYSDLTGPFSEAKATARYLEDEAIEQDLIVVYDCRCTALDAFLQKKVYYLRFDQFGSFCPWNIPIQNENISDRLFSLAMLYKRDIIFIDSEKLITPENQNIIFLRKFANGMVGNEDYYVYRIHLPYPAKKTQEPFFIEKVIP